MEKGFDDLSLMFHTKGFLPIEVPGLIKDIVNTFDKGRCHTMNAVNQELEDLGWLESIHVV